MNIFKKLFTKEVNPDRSRNQLPDFKYTLEPPERLRQSYEIGEIKEENGIVFYWNGHNWVTGDTKYDNVITFDEAELISLPYIVYEEQLSKIDQLPVSKYLLDRQLYILKDFAEKLGLVEAKNYLNNLNK